MTDLSVLPGVGDDRVDRALRDLWGPQAFKSAFVFATLGMMVTNAVIGLARPPLYTLNVRQFTATKVALSALVFYISSIIYAIWTARRASTTNQTVDQQTSKS